MSQLFSHSWFQLAPTKLELSGSLERHFHPVHTFVLINVRWSSAMHTKPQHLSLLSLGTPFSVCSYLHISDLLSSPLERTGSPKRRKHMNSVSTHWKLLAMWISLCSLSLDHSPLSSFLSPSPLLVLLFLLLLLLLLLFLLSFYLTLSCFLIFLSSIVIFPFLPPKVFPQLLTLSSYAQLPFSLHNLLIILMLPSSTPTHNESLQSHDSFSSPF